MKAEIVSVRTSRDSHQTQLRVDGHMVTTPNSKSGQFLRDIADAINRDAAASEWLPYGTRVAVRGMPDVEAFSGYVMGHRRELDSYSIMKHHDQADFVVPREFVAKIVVNGQAVTQEELQAELSKLQRQIDKELAEIKEMVDDDKTAHIAVRGYGFNWSNAVVATPDGKVRRWQSTDDQRKVIGELVDAGTPGAFKVTRE